MSSKGPDQIAIEHDDYHAKYVGWTQDARQFFLTTPFQTAARGAEGREFLALYIFNTDGKLLCADIEELGPHEKIERDHARSRITHKLAELGRVRYSRIAVAPFEIERFGVVFGLVPRNPEAEGEPWAVEAQPGNYMAFFEPWDSGEYDT